MVQLGRVDKGDQTEQPVRERKMRRGLRIQGEKAGLEAKTRQQHMYFCNSFPKCGCRSGAVVERDLEVLKNEREEGMEAKE